MKPKVTKSNSKKKCDGKSKIQSKGKGRGKGVGKGKGPIGRHKPNKKLAKKLGAAYKPGYPVTYLKGQTKPRYRVSKEAQQRELDRLSAASGLPKRYANNLMIKKYSKSRVKWLIEEKAPSAVIRNKGDFKNEK